MNASLRAQTTPRTCSDAIVVGGGIAGASVAYHLVRAGARTLLIDAAEAGSATAASAGILCPAESTCAASGSWFELAARAVAGYPRLVEELERVTGARPTWEPSPLLCVAQDEREEAALAASVEQALQRRARLGHATVGEVEELNASEAQRWFPPLGPCRRAVLFRQAARMDGREMTRALRGAAGRWGLQSVRDRVRGLDLEEGRVRGVVGDEGTYRAGRVVLAGGVWLKRLCEPLFDLPLEPERGQIAHFRVAEPTHRWSILCGMRHHYVLPFAGGRIVAGATRERGAAEAVVTARGQQEVLEHLLRLAPGLGTAELLEWRVGLRPRSHDNLPILGPAPECAGLFLATGYGAGGLHLGPYCGRLVADQVLGREPEMDGSAFLADRFVGTGRA